MDVAITKNMADLERLEGIITRNLQSFYEVGRALMEIRDKQLYEKVRGIATFETYCKERWDFKRTYAFYMIESAKVIDNVHLGEQNTPAPTTERQARALASLPAEKQAPAWQRAVATAPEGKVTAAHVYKIVKAMTNQEPEAKSTETSEDSDALFHLKRWWKKATKKDQKLFLHWTESEGGK